MALGKNMKRRKLIPEKEEDKDIVVTPNEVVEKTAIKAQENKPKTASTLPENSEKTKQTAYSETIEGVTFSVQPSKRKSVKKVNVTIEGKLSVINATVITNKIKEIVAQYEVIYFKLINIQEFDLSSIQILYYFTNLYNKGEKVIKFQIEGLPMRLKTLLVKTKYNKILFKKLTI